MSHKILYVVAAAWVLAFLWQTYAHAQLAEEEDNQCYKTTDTFVPCTELGTIYECGSAVDEVFVKHNHLLSDLSSHTITIYTRTGSGRKHARGPAVSYDLEKDKLTLNGKRCRPYSKERSK